MEATIIRIRERPSQYGGKFFHVFFKGGDGRSYRSCIYPNCRNYLRWKEVLWEGVILENLRPVGRNLIDADSLFQIKRG